MAITLENSFDTHKNTQIFGSLGYLRGRWKFRRQKFRRQKIGRRNFVVLANPEISSSEILSSEFSSH